ncbi:MAG: SurA N-terminal domain-containing protein [Victivallales bacterium]|nr:SurA N-terminal domain-containing protein [Victivallales bacterium]
MFKKLSIACAVLLAAVTARAEDMYYSDAVLAQIDDQVITSYEVKQHAEKHEAALRQQFKGQELVDKIVALRKQVLDTLIERELIYMEFKNMKATVPPFLIQERLDDLIMSTSGGDIREFENTLNIREKMTMSELKDKISKDIAIELLKQNRVTKGILIADSDIDDYYKHNATDFIRPRSFRYSVIQIKKNGGRYADKIKEVCDTIAKKLADGEPFDELAKKYSEGANAENGGDQGWMVRVNEQLLEVINKMEPGQTWPKPIDLGYNIYFLHINEIDGGGIPELTPELRKTIKEKLSKLEEKKKYDAFIKELSMKYPVKRMNGLKY